MPILTPASGRRASSCCGKLTITVRLRGLRIFAIFAIFATEFVLANAIGHRAHRAIGPIVMSQCPLTPSYPVAVVVSSRGYVRHRDPCGSY